MFLFLKLNFMSALFTCNALPSSSSSFSILLSLACIKKKKQVLFKPSLFVQVKFIECCVCFQCISKCSCTVFNVVCYKGFVVFVVVLELLQPMSSVLSPEFSLSPSEMHFAPSGPMSFPNVVLFCL